MFAREEAAQAEPRESVVCSRTLERGGCRMGHLQELELCPDGDEDLGKGVSRAVTGALRGCGGGRRSMLG